MILNQQLHKTKNYTTHIPPFLNQKQVPEIGGADLQLTTLDWSGPGGQLAMDFGIAACIEIGMFTSLCIMAPLPPICVYIQDISSNIK